MVMCQTETTDGIYITFYISTLCSSSLTPTRLHLHETEKKQEIKIRQGKYHLAIQVGDALLSFKEKNHQPRQRVNHFRSIHGNLLARIRKSTILFSNSETEPYWRGGKKGWSLLEFVSGWILAISTEFYEPECHGSRKKAKTSDQSEQREIVFFPFSLSLFREN